MARPVSGIARAAELSAFLHLKAAPSAEKRSVKYAGSPQCISVPEIRAVMRRLSPP
jgi:hypothetical protein